MMTDVISMPNVLINTQQVFLVYAILLLNYTLFTSHIPSPYGKHDFMLYTCMLSRICSLNDQEWSFGISN